MAKETIIRNGVKILGSLASGTGDPLLTLNSASKQVTSIPSMSTGLSPTLPNGYIFIGNGSNIATGVPITGDIAITNTGVASIPLSTIADNQIKASAAITITKLAYGTANQLLATNNAGNSTEYKTVSNGIISASGTLKLGGSLTGDTTILGAGFDLILGTGGSKIEGFEVVTNTTIDLTTDNFNLAAPTDMIITGGGGCVVEFSSGIMEFNAPVINLVPSTSISITGKPINYSTDYSGSYTTRSLVDKGYVLGAKTFTGKQTFLASSTGGAGINIGAGSAAPTSPVDYDLWGTGNHSYIRLNGVTYQLDQQSGIGGSTGSTDNSVLRADGTGGATLQASAAVINDSGDLKIGSSSISGYRDISVASSDTDAGITFTNKNAGEFIFQNSDLSKQGWLNGINQSIDLITDLNNATGIELEFFKGRGTYGSASLIQNGDTIGVLNFGGAIDTAAFTLSAYVQAVVNGTVVGVSPGPASVPVDLVFATGSNSGANPTVERLRIGSTGILTIADGSNITLGTSNGTKIGTATNQKMGFFNTAPVIQQTSAANLTNSVTSGGSNDVIADFTSLSVYATDAATIRNDIYQLARKLKQVNDALRLYGLLS